MPSLKKINTITKINIQKGVLKNKSELFKYTFNKNLLKNYQKKFIISNFDNYIRKDLNKTVHIEYTNKPYILLFKNYSIISNMMYNLSYNQRKHFLRLNAYMKSCKNYDKNILKKFNKCSYKEYNQSFRKCINLLIAYDSYITNEDIYNCISFVAFQLGLISKENENELLIKSWNDLYDYCKEHSFGYVLNTYEQYINFKNKKYCSYYNVSNIIEDAFLTFEHYEIILNELFKSL